MPCVATFPGARARITGGKAYTENARDRVVFEWRDGWRRVY